MKIEENWADVFIYIIEFKPLSNLRELKKITRTIVIEEELSIEEVKELFLKKVSGIDTITFIDFLDDGWHLKKKSCSKEMLLTE